MQSKTSKLITYQQRLQYLKKHHELSLRGVKIEFKGPRHKYNEFIQLRSNTVGELARIVQHIADGQSMAANQYVESIVVYAACVANLGERGSKLRLWHEFDRVEQDIVWKVDVRIT